jgi:hypothetical protein
VLLASVAVGSSTETTGQALGEAAEILSVKRQARKASVTTTARDRNATNVTSCAPKNRRPFVLLKIVSTVSSENHDWFVPSEELVKTDTARTFTW